MNLTRELGRALEPPGIQPPARYLSSLYEIRFRPENIKIAPLTSIAPPAAGFTGNPRPGAGAWKDSRNVCRADSLKLPQASPKIPKPTSAVPIMATNFTAPSSRGCGPEWFFTAFPDSHPRRNHYGRQAIPDPYRGLSVLYLFLGEHQGLTFF
jgi:hypothetical protein